MGVYIPNMEMPKSCWSCELLSSCKAMPKNPTAEEIGIYTVMRLKDCPLIEIVPCKECKWWEKFEGGIWETVEGEYGFCTLRVDGYQPFGGDNFCSYGERPNATQRTQRVESVGE